MTRRQTSTAVDTAVSLLAARLDELRAKVALTHAERDEVMDLVEVLADIEAKQEHAANQRASIMLAALVGRRSLDNLPVHERALAIRAITGEEQEELKPVGGKPDEPEEP